MRRAGSAAGALVLTVAFVVILTAAPAAAVVVLAAGVLYLERCNARLGRQLDEAIRAGAAS